MITTQRWEWVRNEYHSYLQIPFCLLKDPVLALSHQHGQ